MPEISQRSADLLRQMVGAAVFEAGERRVELLRQAHERPEAAEELRGEAGRLQGCIDEMRFADMELQGSEWLG